MSGEVFGKFSVKLTRAINTPPDAFGVGMRGILCITLSVPPARGSFGGEKGTVCLRFGETEFQREISVFGRWSL